VTSNSPARSRSALLAVLLVLALGGVVLPLGGTVVHAAPRVAQEPGEARERGTGQEEAAGGWSSTIAKAVNFAVLAGLLAYFLKTPIAQHLQTRSQTIRQGLTEAAALREEAERQLAAVRARLAELPAELDRLRRRGQEELADERVRLAEATALEKRRVIERTRREIDLQLRVARRRLLEHAAELSISRARIRIERDITPDDQARLIDRYAAEVRA
jgi:F-type H+-transporting ATPase subunit b